jgi:hypothetical protein
MILHMGQGLEASSFKNCRRDSSRRGYPRQAGCSRGWGCKNLSLPLMPKGLVAWWRLLALECLQEESCNRNLTSLTFRAQETGVFVQRCTHGISSWIQRGRGPGLIAFAGNHQNPPCSSRHGPATQGRLGCVRGSHAQVQPRYAYRDTSKFTMEAIH